MGETPEVNLGGGTKLQRPLFPSFSKREDDKRKPPRAGRVDPRHGHEQDGGNTEGDRGDGGRAQRPPDRRHRRVLLRRVPLDGQHWLWHQEQLEGVSGQLAETFPGRLLRQGVHRRGEALHGRVGSRLWSPGGKTLRRVHGNRAHGEADRDPVHGLLEGGGRQDRGQLRLPRLPSRDGSAWQGCLRREWLGGLRQGRARPSCTDGKIENSNENIALYGSSKALFCGVYFLSMMKCIGTKSISTSIENAKFGHCLARFVQYWLFCRQFTHML